MRIGIDLGGTKTELLAIDARGGELFRKRVATPANDYAATLQIITELIDNAEQQLNERGRIGICIPGALSPDTGRVKNANSVCLIGEQPDLDLSKRLQRPVRIANDADCFTLSEATDGAGAGAGTVFGVILGTGVGGGITIGGRLLSGPNRIAGEWGHNPLPWPGSTDTPAADCYCGKRDCIETWLSGPGLCNRYYQQSGLRVDRVEDILAKAEGGQPAAQQLMERYYDQLARSLATVINILDPDVIVLGGGLSNITPLYQQIPRRWNEWVFSDQVNTRLLPASHGDSSGVRGAAWLWS